MKKDKELNAEFDENANSKDKVALTEDAFADAVDGTSAYRDDALSDELEKLAETFRTELKKAQEESEKNKLSDDELFGVKKPEVFKDSMGIIAEEELCECCGEKRKLRNSEYCEECREAMKHYPISFQSVVMLLAVLVVCVTSLLAFINDFVDYNTVRYAEECYGKNELYTAAEYYTNAAESFEEKDVVPKAVYLKLSDILYKTMPNGVSSMSDISTYIGKALSQFELNMPIYANYKDLREKTAVLYGTMQKFYEIVNDEKYSAFYEADTDIDDGLYEEIMTAIGSVIDEEVSVVSVDKKTTEQLPADEAIVRFCQYMFAYSVGKYDDSYLYMQKVEEANPDYVWLYAYELGLAHLQKGNVDDAERLAKALRDNNAEDTSGYILSSSIYRMTGKLDKAVEWVDKGLEHNSVDSESLRVKAMALIAKGEYEDALTACEEALENDEYGLLYMTAMVAANEVGEEEYLESLKSAMSDNGMKLTEKMTKYFDGKITAYEMFTEGTGDVE